MFSRTLRLWCRKQEVAPICQDRAYCPISSSSASIRIKSLDGVRIISSRLCFDWTSFTTDKSGFPGMNRLGEPSVNDLTSTASLGLTRLSLQISFRWQRKLGSTLLFVQLHFHSRLCHHIHESLQRVASVLEIPFI